MLHSLGSQEVATSVSIDTDVLRKIHTYPQVHNPPFKRRYDASVSSRSTGKQIFSYSRRIFIRLKQKVPPLIFSPTIALQEVCKYVKCLFCYLTKTNVQWIANFSPWLMFYNRLMKVLMFHLMIVNCMYLFELNQVRLKKCHFLISMHTLYEKGHTKYPYYFNLFFSQVMWQLTFN